MNQKCFRCWILSTHSTDLKCHRLIGGFGMKTARPDQKKAWCASGYKNTLRVVECGVSLRSAAFSQDNTGFFASQFRHSALPRQGFPSFPFY